jgi:hypothetical protein
MPYLRPGSRLLALRQPYRQDSVPLPSLMSWHLAKQSDSSQGQLNGVFHLNNVGRTRATSPNGNGSNAATSPSITEEDRLLEEIRLERKGVQLLQKAIEVVEGIRKPALA